MRWLLRIACLATFAAGVHAAAADALSPAESERARKLYVRKCARCHKLYDPAGYSDKEWNKWMGTMSRKAKLSESDEQRIKEYTEMLRRDKR
jgi:hypothetical protein